MIINSMPQSRHARVDVKVHLHIKIAFMDEEKSLGIIIIPRSFSSLTLNASRGYVDERSCLTLQPKLVRNKERIFVVTSNHGC